MSASDSLKKKLEITNNKSFAVSEGIELLKQAQTGLSISRDKMKFWNDFEVAMNTMIIPLNIIINAFELKTANGLYKLLVTEIYSKTAKSGTRTDGHASKALDILKKSLLEGVKKKAPDFVPGVNIIVGLAEDTLALYQSIERGKSGQMEAQSIEAGIKRNLRKAEKELEKLNIGRAQIYDAAGRVAKTA
ncbi:hypothetical protein QO001_005519 [Methylobacterium brachiatum]|uniref:Uncharacterized protein n=1 Tax=Methylobacterium brachiatum TaxID=269660 RepID=A0AAJ1WYK2_9HYPH|nr:hypothetical protein [Methylobacterium brachiatum]MCB4805515.1 hypothetical protein [Methylobacterium brachiatum]MDQ0546567.1 hypothetical protein [Methylobacterium brachiatum]